MKIFVNRFVNLNAIPGLCRIVINEDSHMSINNNVHSVIKNLNRLDGDKVSVENPKLNVSDSLNPWKKKLHIKLDLKEDEVTLSDDGKAVKLKEELEVANAKRLSKSLVIKMFGKEVPSHIVAWELRKQWKDFGQFYFTTLGKGWFLCSFSSKEMMEGVLSGGPWFINEHIIGMEKWSPKFNSSSTNRLSSPIWVRMPHLPLQCWNEKSIACIASRIGKPIMLDGNMFHWGRREFARVWVRIQLDQPLPLGVWVDSICGRFFQQVEYEKISNFCFDCRKVGHKEKDCLHMTTVLKNVEDNQGSNIAM
ncbi:hypothetical protein KFK09_001658 [Dendrobium nobile]|uniref:CCHC-type domain-containing protein n=1 Tax=Dendrobium nobile TaxID=94219 RepID=A0A8T3CAX8_DENNO|nr:hypothetical protein KFK09_001658 [Dendrobium nobile]